MDSSSQLRALAALYGLQISYSDNHGTVRSVAVERVVGMLRTLGAPIEDPRRLDDAVRVGELRAWTRLIPPVVVAWEGVGVLEVRLPAHVADAGYRLVVTAESGESLTRNGIMYDVPAKGTKAIGGDRFVRRELNLPGGLAFGYHQLRLEVLGLPPAHAMLVSAPRRAYGPANTQPTWGLFSPLYALHSGRSLATGDLTDLLHVTEWVAERGGSVVGTLPLLATFLHGSREGEEGPFEPSPYAPASRLAWNELYLDVESIPEFSVCAKFWNSSATRAQVAEFRASERVDHGAQMALLRRALQLMSAAAWQNDVRRAELEAFAAERPTIADYARFRAAVTQSRQPWNVWPDELKHGELPSDTYDLEEARYHIYVQWNAHIQLDRLSKRARESGLGLYLDLPVGVHPDGYDIWKYRSVFACGLSSGAPPDALFAGGQNWAFPPLHPHGVREDRYQYLIAVLRNHLRYAGVLRIDHVMGLHRIYAIPQDASPTEGLYLRYHPDELYAILSIESHRNRTLLIGENLGVVPPEVNEAMAEHGVRSMHVVQYAARNEPDCALPPPSKDELASLNTHDMPPFRAFWEGTDCEVRRDLGWIDDATMEWEKRERERLTDAMRLFLSRGTPLPEPLDWHTALRALVRHLGRSDTPLVLLNLEDLWGELRSQNVPGTFLEFPNWQHRARYSFERWREHEGLLALLDVLVEARASAAVRGQMSYDGSKITEDDIYFFNEGTHRHIESFLGSHPMTLNGVEGTYFGVWAPSADYVSVVGDFNRWDRGASPLRVRGDCGIWEGFIAGLGLGDLYKFHIAAPKFTAEKTDPLARRYETPPRTAAVIDKPTYDWQDGEWLATRARSRSLQEPVSIYEVHLGSWKRVPEADHRSLSYREIADPLVEYVKKTGFTHVEFMPLMEHPFYPSWGYQTTGYFAPTSRYGGPTDFMYLIDRLHQAGIGVFLDWVPSHFPCDAHALARFDGTHLYEHADPRQGYHPDWRSSIFNYGRFEVQSFLVSSACHWIEAFHADGLRVDAVASMLYLDYSRKNGEWIPNKYGGRENLEAIDFLRRLNSAIYATAPGVHSIAEESTAWGAVSRPPDHGGLGFGYKWDMGWMHDTLKYFARDPIYRQHHHHELTFRMIYAYNENFVLPLSHDEVVHGKGSLLGRMTGDRWQKFANLRSLYGYMFGLPGKKLLFQGCEFAQEREWAHNESLDWHLLQDRAHAGVHAWVTELNRLYRSEAALHELDCEPEGFEWIDFSDAANSVYVFLRKAAKGRPVLVVANLTPVPRFGYRVGVPHGGPWMELANSDAKPYGGSGVLNAGTLEAEPRSQHGRPFSLELTLPPLGVAFFAPERKA